MTQDTDACVSSSPRLLGPKYNSPLQSAQKIKACEVNQLQMVRIPVE